MNTRVLVVDDASIFRRVITEALAGLPGVEVVGTAANGKAAIARIEALRPDLITLDVEMPEMDGLEVLAALRKSGSDTAVIMLSALTVRGGQMTIRALESGAFDFVTKPEGGAPADNLIRIREGLRPMIQAIGRRKEIRSILHTQRSKPPLETQAQTHEQVSTPIRTRSRTEPPIVVIGVSTGGPTALAQVIPALPSRLGAPVLVVQHMPAHFTEALAQRLQTQSAIQVKEAQDGEVAQADRVYLAPGGRQMKLSAGPRGEIVVRITDDPPENACRPSVDYLFRSVALNFPGRALAVILTGMGNDGTEGMRMLKRSGSLNIAQDEASCVVFGMPREAIQAGVIDTIVPLSRVAESIVRGIHDVGFTPGAA